MSLFGCFFHCFILHLLSSKWRQISYALNHLKHQPRATSWQRKRERTFPVRTPTYDRRCQKSDTTIYAHLTLYLDNSHDRASAVSRWMFMEKQNKTVKHHCSRRRRCYGRPLPLSVSQVGLGCATAYPRNRVRAEGHFYGEGKMQRTSSRLERIASVLTRRLISVGGVEGARCTHHILVAGSIFGYTRRV